MALTGVKGLAAARAAQLAVDRQTGKSGSELIGAVAAGLVNHLAADLRAGSEFAAEAVKVLRASPDLPPGLTDDEVADLVLARLPGRS